MTDGSPLRIAAAYYTDGSRLVAVIDDDKPEGQAWPAPASIFQTLLAESDVVFCKLFVTLIVMHLM